MEIGKAERFIYINYSRVILSRAHAIIYKRVTLAGLYRIVPSFESNCRGGQGGGSNPREALARVRIQELQAR